MRGCGALRQTYGRIRSLTSIVVTQVEAPLQLKPYKALLLYPVSYPMLNLGTHDRFHAKQ